jgi:rod shape-determining protein MreC
MDFIKNKLLTIVLVLCLAFTIFIGITASKKGNTGAIQEVISSAVAPVQKYIYTAGQRISNIFYFVTSISQTRKENTQLKQEIENLRGKLVEYDRYKRENEEISKMLQFKNAHPDLKLKGANVIGKVGENWFSILILDVGEADGVQKDQYVINSQGLIGQVFETTKNTSKFITIIDEKANIPIKISSTGEDGMLTGVSSNGSKSECKITYLPIDTKANVGDAVVTSNILSNENSIMPPDILIGFIERIEDEKPNLVKSAYIKPVVNFAQVEKVMVITK